MLDFIFTSHITSNHNNATMDKLVSYHTKLTEYILMLEKINRNIDCEEDIINIFYEYNVPDFYEMSITTRSNFTRLKIYSSITNTVIINISDTSFRNALIRGVGQFIEYKAAELKPSL